MIRWIGWALNVSYYDELREVEGELKEVLGRMAKKSKVRRPVTKRKTKQKQIVRTLRSKTQILRVVTTEAEWAPLVAYLDKLGVREGDRGITAVRMVKDAAAFRANVEEQFKKDVSPWNGVFLRVQDRLFQENVCGPFDVQDDGAGNGDPAETIIRGVMRLVGLSRSLGEKLTQQAEEFRLTQVDVTSPWHDVYKKIVDKLLTDGICGPFDLEYKDPASVIIRAIERLQVEAGQRAVSPMVQVDPAQIAVVPSSDDLSTEVCLENLANLKTWLLEQQQFERATICAVAIKAIQAN